MKLLSVFFLVLLFGSITFAKNDGTCKIKKNKVSSKSQILEKSEGDLIPPEVFKCNKEGFRSAAGEETCLRHLFCARSRGGLCSSSQFIQGATYVFKANGEVEKKRVGLSELLANPSGPTSLLDQCNKDELVSGIRNKEDPLNCICKKGQEGFDYCNENRFKLNDQNYTFDLFSATVFNGDAYTEDPTIVATGTSGPRTVEYRYFNQDQNQRFLDIVNLKETAAAKYCRLNTSPGFLGTGLFASTTTSCSRFDVPVVLGEFGGLSSAPKKKAKKGEEIGLFTKGSIAGAYGAIKKARKFLDCSPKWAVPEEGYEFNEFEKANSTAQ